MFLIIILIFAFYHIFRFFFPAPVPHVLNVYFGVPGSGKSTFATFLAREHLRESPIIPFLLKHPCPVSDRLLSSSLFKRSGVVYSNVAIKGAKKLDCKADLGRFDVSDGKVIIDEAGVEFNNRNFKSLSADVIYWLKYHRHYGCSVDVFSQSFEDMDITIRRLAQNYFVVKKSLIPFCIVAKRIRRKVGIDDVTHQIVDHYFFDFPFMGTKWIFSPPLWKYFDSFDAKKLPIKNWDIF